MLEKRHVSILVPYLTAENGISVFLQKRSPDAVRLPNHFGFFGGGLEVGESPKDALIREMTEEIGMIPEGYKHFRQYNFGKSVKDVYIVKVDRNFENEVIIGEGEYGKWFTEEEVLQELKLIEEDKFVLKDCFNFLLNK